MSFQNYNENYVSMSLHSFPNNKKTFFDKKINSLDITDIQGARSKFIQKPLHSRQVYNNRNDDIEKSTPKVIIPKSVNKPDRQLSVDDIEGARTKVNKFTTTRNTNPLQPRYQLPTVEYAPFQEPKFIKDNLVIDDIEGTRMKETFAVKLERAGKFIQKDNTLLQQKVKIIPKTNNFLNVLDINYVQKPNRGQRSTNPLQPVYQLPSSKQQPIRIVGPIEGSKAFVPKERRNHTDYCLNTKDIQGAIPQSPKKYMTSKNEQIPESKVGSYKRGVSTNRKTNPLQPNYQYPGFSQNKNSTYARPKTAAQRLDAFIMK